MHDSIRTPRVLDTGRLVSDAPRPAGRQRAQRECAASDRRCRAAALGLGATDARRLFIVVIVVIIVIIVIIFVRPLESVQLGRAEIIVVQGLCCRIGEISGLGGQCLWRRR